MTFVRNSCLNMLALFAAVLVASAPAIAQQQQKPNIVFIMGDDIGWMQPSIYHRGLPPRWRGPRAIPGPWLPTSSAIPSSRLPAWTT